MKGKWLKNLDFDRSTAFIIKNGKILLFHRFRKGKEYWTFPGGSIEKGESPEEALDREINEELNLKILKKKFLFKIKNLGREEYHYLVEDYEGEPKLGAEFGIHNKNNYAIMEWTVIDKIEKMEELYPTEGCKMLIEMLKNNKLK